MRVNHSGILQNTYRKFKKSHEKVFYWLFERIKRLVVGNWFKTP